VKRVASTLAGAIFGVGLVFSGMTQPEKVKAFLDFSGAWDPSLLFVMGSAVLVHAGIGALIRKRAESRFSADLPAPAKLLIDRNLLLGAAIFGVGWGLGGFCPGPALVSAGAGSLAAGIFAVGMAVGMFAERHVARKGVFR
jgi:uncharacterized protein